jgi:hypothetical protein
MGLGSDCAARVVDPQANNERTAITSSPANKAIDLRRMGNSPVVKFATQFASRRAARRGDIINKTIRRAKKRNIAKSQIFCRTGDIWTQIA